MKYYLEFHSHIKYLTTISILFCLFVVCFCSEHQMHNINEVRTKCQVSEVFKCLKWEHLCQVSGFLMILILNIWTLWTPDTVFYNFRCNVSEVFLKFNAKYCLCFFSIRRKSMTNFSFITIYLSLIINLHIFLWNRRI